MKYIKTFESFINDGNQYTIDLKEIPSKDAMFDSGYTSPNIKGSTKFFEIIAKEEGPIGEFEWGQVDKNTVEIVSLFIRKEFRKNKSGRNSFEAFCKKLNNPTIILKATPQSKGFWKHMGFKLMPGTKDYYQYK